MADKEEGTITVDGIELHGVTEDTIDDYEILEAFAEIQEDEGNLTACVRLCKLVLGDDYAAVKDALRERNGGKIPARAVLDFVESVLEALGTDSKN